MTLMQEFHDSEVAAVSVRQTILTVLDQRCQNLRHYIEQRDALAASITTAHDELSTAKGQLDDSQAKLDGSPLKILAGKITGTIFGIIGGAFSGATGVLSSMVPAASPLGGAFGAAKGAGDGWKDGEKFIKGLLAPQHESLSAAYAEAVQKTVLALPNLMQELKSISETMPVRADATLQRLEVLKSEIEASSLYSANPIDYMDFDQLPLLFDDTPDYREALSRIYLQSYVPIAEPQPEPEFA